MLSKPGAMLRVSLDLVMNWRYLRRNVVDFPVDTKLNRERVSKV